MSLLRLLASIVLAVFLSQFITGCQAFQTDKTFDILHGMSVEVQKTMQNGSAQQFSVAAQGINPKIKVAVGVEYYAIAGYDGLAGQVSANGAGVRKELAEGDKALIEAILRDTSLSDRERAERIKSLIQSVVK